MAKGGDFERETARLLSLWWSDGQRDDIFYRSHASGGRFTVRRKSGKDTALQGGDLTCSDPCGEPLIKAWNVEDKTGYCDEEKLKNADGSAVVRTVKTKGGGTRICEVTQKKRWDVMDFVDSQQDKPVLETFWDQCVRDAESTGREPILIFRRSGRKACIMFSIEYQKRLQRYFGNADNFAKTFVITRVGEKCVIIIKLTDFFEWIPDIRAVLCSKD